MKDQIKDQIKDKMGTTGLIFNEPLLWEKGSPGRKGLSLPRRDVDETPLDDTLRGGAPLYQALPVELWGGQRHVPAGLLHHEIQPQDQ